MIKSAKDLRASERERCASEVEAYGPAFIAMGSLKGAAICEKLATYLRENPVLEPGDHVAD